MDSTVRADSLSFSFNLFCLITTVSILSMESGGAASFWAKALPERSVEIIISSGSLKRIGDS